MYLDTLCFIWQPSIETLTFHPRTPWTRSPARFLGLPEGTGAPGSHPSHPLLLEALFLFCPTSATMDLPCSLSLLPQSSSRTSCGVWPAFTDLDGRMEGTCSSAQSRKHTCYLSDSTGPEFCHCAPTWGSLTGPAPHGSPPPISVFPDSPSSHPLQASSKPHTNPCSFSPQHPLIFFLTCSLSWLFHRVGMRLKFTFTIKNVLSKSDFPRLAWRCGGSDSMLLQGTQFSP